MVVASGQGQLGDGMEHRECWQFGRSLHPPGTIVLSFCTIATQADGKDPVRPICGDERTAGGQHGTALPAECHTCTASLHIADGSSPSLERHRPSTDMDLLLSHLRCRPLITPTGPRLADIWRLMIRKSQRHGGTGLLEYNKVFRQQAPLDEPVQ